MTLQKHVIRIVVLSVSVMLFGSLVGLKALLHFGLELNNQVMMAGFQKVESSWAEREIRRAQNAFQSEILRLEEFSVDWAQWDDMWVYANNHNMEFEKSNFIPEAFQAKRISHFFVFDRNNQVVGGVCLQNCENVSSIPADIAEILPHNSSIFSFDSLGDKVHSGLLWSPFGPLLFAARPILQSNGSGPIRGTVLFTKLLDQMNLFMLSDLTSLRLSIQPVDEEVTQQSWPKFHSPNDSVLYGELLMRDYFNVPRFRMIITMNRTVYQNALQASSRISVLAGKTQLVLTASTFVSAIILIGILGYFLTRLIIRRIRILSEGTAVIREQADLSYRIPDLGSDEIGNLGNQFNTMLASLEQSRSQIQSQNMERKALLDALPTGIFALDASFCIVPTPSATALQFLGQDCVGMPLTQVLHFDKDQEQKLLDFLDVFSQELLPVSEMAALNPFRELQIHETPPLWVRISYYRLPHGRYPQLNEPVILTVLEDITLVRTTADELRECTFENNWLRAVLADPDLFLEFFRESEQALAQISTHLSGRIDRNLVARAFRHAHTLQGCALGFGLEDLSDATITLESKLGFLLTALEKGSEVDKFDAANGARDGIQPVRVILESEKNRLHKILSQQVMDWKSGPSIRLPLHKLREWSALITSGENDAVQHSIEDCFQLPVSRILHRTLLWFPGLIARSQKKAVLELEGEEIRLPMDWAGLLNDILLHLLRNSVAHGIELPEERTLLGKPEHGVIRIIVQKEGDHLGISVEDDGKGFNVDIGSAFLLGFSSADPSDKLAGRGIGLHAVKAMVEELGGKIVLSSTPTKGTKFHLYFDLQPKSVL